jgi:hypothetical protein
MENSPSQAFVRSFMAWAMSLEGGKSRMMTKFRYTKALGCGCPQQQVLVSRISIFDRNFVNFQLTRTAPEPRQN